MPLYPIYIFLLLSQILSYCNTQKLNFNSNGTFTILQLTDLHYGEDIWDDENNIRIQGELLEKVKPDMVVVTGDSVSGYAYHGQPDYQKNAWEKFTRAFYNKKTYYAFALGNHDAYDGGLDPGVLHELERASNYSLLAHYEENSFLNWTYYLPVYSGINEGNVSAFLWLFDSHSVGCADDINSWGCINNTEVDWYRNTSQVLADKYGTNMQHLAFFHIPVPEFLDMYNTQDVYGDRNEPVSCPRINTGVFDAFKDVGNIEAVFCGHDHSNDFGGWYEGIELVYGRKTGYGGYGPVAGYSRGGRVITLTESLQPDGTVKVVRDHYVVLENEDEETAPKQSGFLSINRHLQEYCPSLNESTCYKHSHSYRESLLNGTKIHE